MDKINFEKITNKKVVGIIVFSLLLTMFIEATMSMRLKSLTSDETAHLPAGYSYLMTGDYRMNQEQPPLMKLLAGVPLLFLRPNLPVGSAAWENSDEWRFGRQFLYFSGNDADRIIFWGRVPIVLLALLLGYFIFLWAGRLYGPAAGIFALFFYVFSPNMLAHCRLVTMDFGLGCFMLIGCYYAWSYLERPSVKELILSGIFTGLALTAKFSGLLMIPVLSIMFAYRFFYAKKDPQALSGGKYGTAAGGAWFMAGSFIAIWVMSAAVIFATYGFKSDALALYGHGVHMIYGNASPNYKFYLNGHFSSKPWWYYYLYAFLIKTPIPTLILTALAALRIRKRGLYNELWLILPVAIVNIAGFFDAANLGLRRILPVYPFIFVFISKAVALKDRGAAPVKKNAYYGMLAVLCVWYLVSGVRIFPDYLTYFNEFIGGPKNGIYHLDDSNIDWGEDLKRLKTYMDSHNIDRVKLLYVWNADPGYYGIKTEPVTDAEIVNQPLKGHYYAISVHLLPRLGLGATERGYGIDWLKEFKPVAVIGNSIYIYKF